MEGDSSKTNSSDLNDAALHIHKDPPPGKRGSQATTAPGNQRHRARAYSPGVAARRLAIPDEPAAAADYTARATRVGGVSNGTAALGRGNIGPLASKPVME